MISLNQTAEIAHLREIIHNIHSKYNVSFLEERQIPINIFHGRKDVVKALASYLLFSQESISFVSDLLCKKEREIHNLYDKSIDFSSQGDNYVPVSIFKKENNKRSIMESIVYYLRERKRMKLSEIANLLGRNQRTVWTMWHRANSKESVKE